MSLDQYASINKQKFCLWKKLSLPQGLLLKIGWKFCPGQRDDKA